MSTAENKALVRRMIEDVVNARRLDLVDEVFAADYVARGRVVGLDAVRQAIERHHSDLSSFRETIEEMIAEGDAVVVRLVVQGTHTGEMSIGGISVPATGKFVTWNGIAILRVANGKITEELGIGDNLGLLRQLGVLPLSG